MMASSSPSSRLFLSVLSLLAANEVDSLCYTTIAWGNPCSFITAQRQHHHAHHHIMIDDINISTSTSSTRHQKHRRDRIQRASTTRLSIAASDEDGGGSTPSNGSVSNKPSSVKNNISNLSKKLQRTNNTLSLSKANKKHVSQQHHNTSHKDVALLKLKLKEAELVEKILFDAGKEDLV